MQILVEMISYPTQSISLRRCTKSYGVSPSWVRWRRSSPWPNSYSATLRRRRRFSLAVRRSSNPRNHSSRSCSMDGSRRSPRSWRHLITSWPCRSQVSWWRSIWMMVCWGWIIARSWSTWSRRCGSYASWGSGSRSRSRSSRSRRWVRSTTRKLWRWSRWPTSTTKCRIRLWIHRNPYWWTKL